MSIKLKDYMLKIEEAFETGGQLYEAKIPEKFLKTSYNPNIISAHAKMAIQKAKMGILKNPENVLDHLAAIARAAGKTDISLTSTDTSWIVRTLIKSKMPRKKFSVKVADASYIRNVKISWEDGISAFALASLLGPLVDQQDTRGHDNTFVHNGITITLALINFEREILASSLNKLKKFIQDTPELYDYVLAHRETPRGALYISHDLFLDGPSYKKYKGQIDAIFGFELLERKFFSFAINDAALINMAFH